MAAPSGNRSSPSERIPSSVENATASIAWHHGSVTEPRQPWLHGTAFALRDPFPWPEFVQLAREGEGLGYSAVFLPEIAGRDALVALGELAGETEDLRLGHRHHPDAIADAGAHGDGRRYRAGAFGRPARAGHRHRAGRCRGALERSPGPDPHDPSPAGRRAPSSPTDGRFACRSSRVIRRPDLDVGAGPSRDAAGGRGRRRRAAELVHARARRGSRGRVIAGRSRGGRSRSGGRRPSAVYVRASLGGEREACDALLAGGGGEYASYPAYAPAVRAHGAGGGGGGGRRGASRRDDPTTSPSGWSAPSALLGDRSRRARAPRRLPRGRRRSPGGVPGRRPRATPSDRSPRR